MSDATKRPRPQPTPETKFFWEGCARGELLLQKDNATGKCYFPPRPFVPGTGVGGAFNLTPKRAGNLPLNRVTLGWDGGDARAGRL